MGQGEKAILPLWRLQTRCECVHGRLWIKRSRRARAREMSASGRSLPFVKGSFGSTADSAFLGGTQCNRGAPVAKVWR